MRDFYSEWKCSSGNRETNQRYIRAFLKKEPETFSFLNDGYSHEQFVDMLTLFQSVPTESFFEHICSQIDFCPYDTAEISQFSDFEKGAIAVPQILEFYPQGITFAALGEKLIAAKEHEANRKYGENHASLAAQMSLSRIEGRQQKLVFPTSLGHFLIDYEMREKEKLLKAMLMRNPFIQSMIKITIGGEGNYHSLVEGLTRSTAKRRRQSIRHLLQFILDKTEQEEKYMFIDWTL